MELPPPAHVCTVCGVPIQPHVKQCNLHRGGAKSLAKQKERATQVPAKTEEPEAKGKPDRWAALHGGKVIGAVQNIASLDQVDQHPGHGLPDLQTLGAMVKVGERLDIVPAVGKHDEPLGISFNIVRYSVAAKKKEPVKTELYEGHVKNKGSSAICYENTFLPLEASGGHVLVHQSLGPCALCQRGYSEWAKKDKCTIVVAFDKPYDGQGKGRVFIFSPTGHTFLI